MALLKELTNEKGIVTTYHKISRVNLARNQVHCGIDSYVSKDYRDAEQPADSSMFSFGITVAEEESMGIRALCYNKIKALEAWSDAADC